MKKRLFALWIAIAMILCVVHITTITVHANEPVDEIAAKCIKAIEAQELVVEFTIDGGDVESLLDHVFAEYPVLFHYYDGCRWTTYHDRIEVTVLLRDTDHSMADIWIIASDEELAAALGMGLLRIQSEVYFVTEDGYTVSADTINEALDWLHHECYLAYMGYRGWQSSFYERASTGIQDYAISYEYYYNTDSATLHKWRDETEHVALQVASSIFAQDMPDYLKVLRIHDWIVNNTRYNTTDMSESGNHLAYGAMVKGSCVCMGYAETGVLLFQAAGIESRYISGTGTNSEGQTEAHAWNAVNVDGDWYLVDMTWDDPTSPNGLDVLKYDYFLLTDSQLAMNHNWDREKVPVCNGGPWNASRALEEAGKDNGAYMNYDPSLLVTQEEAEEYFNQLLRSGNEPITYNPDTSKTEQFFSSVVPNQSSNEESPKNSNVRIIVSVVVIAILGIVAMVIVLVMSEKKRREEMKRRKRHRPVSFRDL